MASALTRNFVADSEADTDADQCKRTFKGELASVVIAFRERNRLLSHGQLSWSFVDESGFELAPRHLWLLTFLKSPKFVFSDGSTYNSWNAAAGVTAAGCHELAKAPSDMSLTHISELADLISFDNELPVSTPRAMGGVSDVFVDNSPPNPSMNDDLLDDCSVSRIEGLLYEVYQKFELKFDNFEQQLDIKLQEKLDNFDQKLDVRFREQLEQFESNFTDKLDTVISERIDANLSERKQTEFDRFEGEMDMKFVKLRGEVMQASEKFTDLQSAMTDELTSFRSTVIQEIDTKLDVKFYSVRKRI